MTNLFHFIKNHKLIVLGIIIHISFFISAVWTKWYDYFFFGSSLHYCCQGLDFYQIPNGFYAFTHGGDLTGKLPLGQLPYSGSFPSNSNVYHPVLTLLGGVFVLFDPKYSFYIWIWIKLIINLLVVYYLYRHFKSNRYLNLAIFFFLTNFSQYSEIKISQYQYLLNISLLFFLIEITTRGNHKLSGIWYLITLLVKPIGLIFAPILLLRGKHKTLFIGLLSFVIITTVFSVNGMGNYYITNLSNQIFHPIASTTIDILSLETYLRHSLNFSVLQIQILKLIMLSLIILLAFYKKVEIIKCFYLAVLYFLFFYDLVYQYHYSILIPLLTVCLLISKDFQKLSSRILLFIISLPNIFFILRYFKIGFRFDSFLGPDPTWLGWNIIMLNLLIPIILLTFVIFKDDFVIR